MNKKLDEKLLKLRRESEERMAERRAEKLGAKYINLSKTPVNIEALALLPEELARKGRIAAIEKKNEKIAAVAVDSASSETKKAVDYLKSKGFDVSVFIISQSSFIHALDFYKFVSKEKESITGKIDIEKLSKEIKEKKIDSLENIAQVLSEEEFAPRKAAEILDIILQGALANRGSDIHLEPSDKGANLRIRIDGLLHDVFKISKEFYPYLISKIKLLSNLKINISNEPQDGRFTIKFGNHEIEVRVAVAPAQFGEVAVMRLLDPAAINIDLHELGIRDDDLEIVKKELKKPNGMILNTGPTGSGKTTTLYAFLKYKKTPEVKIITIEDPIEYRIEGIEQTQVDETKKYTFADGLKSLMRQDPDIILIGEIRDQETAITSVQSALTGHLVFSTVHANSASGAIPRLLDLGVKAQSIGPALNLIIGQRLVRKICLKCRIPAQISDDLKNKIHLFLEKLPSRINKEKYKDIEIYESKGCPACNNAGYRGRIAIYELLLAGPEIEELILKQAGETEFIKFAESQGMTTLQQDGILKVIEGITTFKEVETVTGPIEWL
ncbi:MAG: GspE/PulE family protein [Patescibacteria group bacterium]|nr:GspE/PulE family protein [Patescibacteria group bacterium]